jgi:hypothetical protein
METNAEGKSKAEKQNGKNENLVAREGLTEGPFEVRWWMCMP